MNNIPLHLLSVVLLLFGKLIARSWLSLCRTVMTDNRDNDTLTLVDNSFGRLPDHLLIEIFIRLPVSEWAQISCVKKQWASLFLGEGLWHAALMRTYPSASQAKRWPGPIPQGLSKRLNKICSVVFCAYAFSFPLLFFLPN